MSAHHHHHPPSSEHGGTPPTHRPYWKRAHTDWRIWVVALLMILLMFVYLATGDLAWRPGAHGNQPAQTVPIAP